MNGRDAAHPSERRDVLAETFEAVLFDNDSTLLDSLGAVDRSWQRWAQIYGVPADRLVDLHGIPSRQTIARLAPELDLDEADAAFGRLEMEDLDDVSALPGAREALAAVGDHGAVVTSAGTRLLHARLAAAGLSEALSATTVLVSADDVTHGKPAPDPYLEGARRLGVDVRRCLVVEDSVAGVRSGRSAGAATLALLTTTAQEQLGEADLVVQDLSHVRFRAVAGGVRVELSSERKLH